MTAARLRAAIVGGGIAILGAAAIAVGSGAQAVAADPADVGQAKALGHIDAPVGAGAANRSGSARARAAKVSGQVPLPKGESFDDIQWENGELSDADIQGLLEFNAACKWWLADADGTSKDAPVVVAQIPSWPTMREGQRHEIAAAMVPGGDAGLAADTVAYCRDSVG
ncbi:MAG: hypothetical protein PGN13_07410 [Patulibacter minatonensis]